MRWPIRTDGFTPNAIRTVTARSVAEGCLHRPMSHIAQQTHGKSLVNNGPNVHVERHKIEDLPSFSKK